MGRWTWRLVWSHDNWIDRKAIREADRIIQDAQRADPETMGRIVGLLRSPAQGYSSRTQAEIDGVIARWRASQLMREGGDGMYGPAGPIGPGPR